ncbi:FTR1 family protein [Pseudoxanthomonas sp. SGT-18]|uniref:FTR1 family protein n=1 Tax=Pseudoxanthomonas sp. SGT-18 TaxID=2493087 RepID=UPI001F0C9015|nr:FTR1 family protein [Pseudoxanthomonas sp. SGT-18]
MVAMIALLRKAERTEMLPWVHAGWLSALLAGVVTWGLATWVITISGASRELTEGFGSLLAAIVLVWVGIWMHGKSHADAWQRYVREKLGHALSKKSGIFLLGLVFLVVYREVFETILFFAAIWNQGSQASMVAGGAHHLVRGRLAGGAAGYLSHAAGRGCTDRHRLGIGDRIRLVGAFASALPGKAVSALDSVRAALERHQIAVYFAAVVQGFLTALAVPGTAQWEGAINPALGLMLFVTFLQVPLARLRDALKNTRFMGALLVANFLVVPLLGALLLPLLPADPLIRIAVLFVLLCPCIDYVVTFSHLGKADASLLLAATPVLLIVQMLLLPLYLGVLLGAESASLVKAGPFLHAFGWLIVVPMLLAASVQAAARRWAPAARAADWGGLLPVPATALVLLIVIAAVTPKLGPALKAAATALPFYVAFAVIAPVLGLLVGRAFGLGVSAKRAVAFSSAMRNSLVILPLALSVPGALPVVPAVIVTQTLVELVAMLVYIPLLPRLSPR